MCRKFYVIKIHFRTQQIKEHEMLSYNNNYLWFEFIGMKNNPIYL